MNLVESHSLRYDKLNITLKLLCSAAEYVSVKAKYEKLFETIAINLDFFKELGVYEEAYKLYDKLSDIEVIEEEGGKDDMSTARPVVL